MKYLPEGEEILYSTICNTTDKSVKKGKQWRTHVLLTESVFAYYGTSDEEQMRFKLIHWKDLPAEPTTKYQNNKVLFNNFLFETVMDEKYESKKDFSKRAKNFSSFCEALKYESMIKHSNIYVPVDFSGLKNKVPQNENILYSTMSRIKYTYQQGKKQKTKKYDSHVLVTRSKVYFYKYMGSAKSFFWKKIKKFKRKSITNRGFGGIYKIIAIRHEKFETQEVFDSRALHFGPFCKHLKKASEDFLRLMENYANNKNYLSERISKDGFDNFTNDLDWYFYIGRKNSDKQKMSLLQNTFDVISEDLRRSKYDVFKTYKKKNKLFTKEEKKAEKLHRKGAKKVKNGDYEKALIFYEEAIKLNPYDTTIQNSRSETLKYLGKSD